MDILDARIAAQNAEKAARKAARDATRLAAKNAKAAAEKLKKEASMIKNDNARMLKAEKDAEAMDAKLEREAMVVLKAAAKLEAHPLYAENQALKARIAKMEDEMLCSWSRRNVESAWRDICADEEAKMPDEMFKEFLEHWDKRWGPATHISQAITDIIHEILTEDMEGSDDEELRCWKCEEEVNWFSMCNGKKNGKFCGKIVCEDCVDRKRDVDQDEANSDGYGCPDCRGDGTKAPSRKQEDSDDESEESSSDDE